MNPGRSQLEKRYGQDAEAMLSQPATKIFFKTSEPRAAKWISETLGEIELERLKESHSPGLLRTKRNYTMEIATKPLVMASEIAGLAPLAGYIKQENRVVPVRFAYAKKRSLQPEFIERKIERQMTIPYPDRSRRSRLRHLRFLQLLRPGRSWLRLQQRRRQAFTRLREQRRQGPRCLR